MSGNKKIWKCPKGCNMEFVRVYEKEIYERRILSWEKNGYVLTDVRWSM